MATTTYQVTGMSCQHCVHAVTEELARVSGVSSVQVDLVPGGESLVTVASDAALTETTTWQRTSPAGASGGQIAAGLSRLDAARAQPRQGGGG
jgi:copper chaperone